MLATVPVVQLRPVLLVVLVLLLELQLRVEIEELITVMPATDPLEKRSERLLCCIWAIVELQVTLLPISMLMIAELY